MSTPQRSRYPRPLKATQSFTSASTQTSAGKRPSAGSPSGIAAAVPARKTSVEARASPERRSPVSMASKEEEESNPRRSSSMGSLSDSDCYMNSLWPRIPSTNQTEGDPEEAIPNGDNEFYSFTHKRSSSCSSADRLRKTTPPHQISRSGAYTRMSIEGLNQEVSTALEGKPIIEAHLHPDGHVAPVRDLLGRLSIGTQTPPHLSTHSSPSSQSPSPYPLPPSSPAQGPQTDLDLHTGCHNNTNRESPATPELQNLLHPPSPKPSFAREPPDGAERCTIKQDTAHYSEDFIPRGPDRSKGNIVFKGTAFAPLLSCPGPSLKPVPPINSL